VLISPASRRTTTAYSYAHRAVLLASIVHVLGAPAMARAAAASPSKSGSSRQQTSYGSSSAAAGRAAKQTETAQASELAEAKSFLQKGLLAEAEKATRQFLHSHADSAEGHYILGHILFDEVREKYVGEEKKEGEEDKKVYLYERLYGSFSRSFALPSNVDAANIVAEFEKGILKIRLPKFADVKPKGRKVEVKQA